MQDSLSNGNFSNKVSSAQGTSTIKVFIRPRPCQISNGNAFSIEEDGTCISIQRDNQSNVISNGQSNLSSSSGGSINKFKFSKVFPATAEQLSVYNTSINDLISDVVKGINCCVMAYGLPFALKLNLYQLCLLSNPSHYCI
jgi:hypothetical protein